ncbi:MAG: hypothetical protein NC918_05460 [Candidatus Omnitrophica bacterium]|nr:hypothetical protein [Candidatus Omnitrophota bacterium]
MKIFIPVLLSFLLNGIGQFYNGQIKKALFFIISSLIFLCIFVISLVLFYQSFINAVEGIVDKKLILKGVVLFTLSGFILCLIGLLSMVDAYLVAKKKLNKEI